MTCACRCEDVVMACYMLACMCAHMYVRVCVNVLAYTYTSTHVDMCVLVCKCARVCVLCV